MQTDGFELEFTQKVNQAAVESIESTNQNLHLMFQAKYGSPKVDETTPEIISKNGQNENGSNEDKWLRWTYNELKLTAFFQKWKVCPPARRSLLHSENPSHIIVFGLCLEVSTSLPN